MFGMGVGRMGVAIVMGMIVAMFMVMMMRVVHNFKRALGVDAFHMVVMAFLHGAHIGLEAQYGAAVFAHLAVHGDVANKDLLHAFDEGVDHGGMVIEIGGLDEFDTGMAYCHVVSRIIDALHQNSGEKKIGEYDDAPVAKLGRVFQAGFHQRESYTRVSRFGPAEAEAFPENAGDFRDIGIGIGVGRTAAHDHQQGFMQRNVEGLASRAS